MVGEVKEMLPWEYDVHSYLLNHGSRDTRHVNSAWIMIQAVGMMHLSFGETRHKDYREHTIRSNRVLRDRMAYF